MQIHIFVEINKMKKMIVQTDFWGPNNTLKVQVWNPILNIWITFFLLFLVVPGRYMAVTRINYIHSRNCRSIGSMIFAIWFISITVSLAPLFGWKDAGYEERVNVEQQCIISQDVGYQIFATVMTFYAPLVIILLLYWRIFMTARTRLRKRMAAKANINLHQVRNTSFFPYTLY